MRAPILAPVGAAVFTVGWAVLGAVSPGYRLFDLVIEPYDPVSQPISGLGLGATGPWMNAVFVLSGLLVLAGSLAATLAAWRGSGRLLRVGLVLLCCTGVGMVTDGVFTLEQVLVHLAGFVLAVLLPAPGLVVAGIALLRDGRRVGLLAAVAGVVALGLFIAFQVTFDPYSAGDNSGVSGLLQRVLVTALLAAVTGLVALADLAPARTTARKPPVGQPA